VKIEQINGTLEAEHKRELEEIRANGNTSREWEHVKPA
jgi:hypothetical protein